MSYARKKFIAFLTTLAVATLAWAGHAIVSSAERLSRVEAKQELFGEWLERVEDKLDRVLEQR